MTRQEAGRTRAKALTLTQRRRNQHRGAVVKNILNSLGKSDNPSSTPPWAFSHPWPRWNSAKRSQWD
jgi:hypothetical protein